MSRKCGDLFKAARLRAGLKRDPAAEELHIGVRTLDAYESTSEDNEPDMDMIRRMCILYKDPSLARQYIKRSDIGEFFPEVVDVQGDETFQGSTLNAVDKISTAYESVRKLIHIASDGKVNPNETDQWAQVQNLLEEMLTAVTTLIVVKK
jgi:transcriptional regulator with XRE-family HTH domain